MIYEYKCPQCGAQHLSQVRGDRLDAYCCEGEHYVSLRRKFSVSMKPVMQEHYNRAVGRPVSDEKQFADMLKRESEIASLNTGMEHRFVPIDMNDHKANGATSEGIYESNVTRSKNGDPLLPLID